MLVTKFYYKKKKVQNQNEWGHQACFRDAGFFCARSRISSIDTDIR